MRPFRFGVSVSRTNSRAEWAEKARKAEGLGYAVLLVGDHLGLTLSPLVALVDAAEATRSLRVGTFVLNNDFYHPVLLAREAATVDLLTDGRLELGIGAGHMRSEYDRAGLRFDPTSTRVERLVEAVAIIKGLLEGHTVNLYGRHYTTGELERYPIPAQRPRPPILIGGHNKALLSLAAGEADIVGLTGLTQRRGSAAVDIAGFRPEAIDERMALVKDAAGKHFGQLELNALVQHIIVTDDPRRRAAQIADYAGKLSADDVLQSPFVLLGTAEQMAADLRSYRERWGISYYGVFEPAMEAFAPVVAKLAGS